MGSRGLMPPKLLLKAKTKKCCYNMSNDNNQNLKMSSSDISVVCKYIYDIYSGKYVEI